MSQFTPSSKRTFEFEGDQVEVVLRRIKRKDIQKWSKYLKVEDDKIKMTFADQMEMSDVLYDLLPDYVVSMSGLKDANGDEVPLKQVLEEAYFIGLVEMIIKHLFEISNLNKGEAKNSGGPSGGTLKE